MGEMSRPNILRLGNLGDRNECSSREIQPLPEQRSRIFRVEGWSFLRWASDSRLERLRLSLLLEMREAR